MESFYSLKDDPTSILDDWTFYEREGMAELHALTGEEPERSHSTLPSAKDFPEWTFQEYATIYEELNQIEEKHQKASKIIEGMAKKIKDMENAGKAA